LWHALHATKRVIREFPTSEPLCEQATVQPGAYSAQLRTPLHNPKPSRLTLVCALWHALHATKRVIREFPTFAPLYERA